VPAADVGTGSYHGGALGDQPALAYVLVERDAETVDVLVTARAECEGYDLPLQATVAFTDRALDGDGTATFTKPVTDRATGPGGRPARENGEASVMLEVAPDGRASGVMRLRSTFTDLETGEQVAACDTGAVAFDVVAVRPSAGEGRARRPRRGGTYLGVAGGGPLVADVRRNGTIDRMAFLYSSPCLRRAGLAAQRIVFVPRITPGRKGAFRVRGTQQLFVGDGRSENVVFRMTGRYGRDGGLRGTVRVEGELGGDTCDTLELKWRAARAAH
jgi:hypothetical protein